MTTKNYTNLAIDMNPQDAVACKGVHPSLSPRLISAPCSTKNSTISKSSSIQACYVIITITLVINNIMIFYTAIVPGWYKSKEAKNMHD